MKTALQRELDALGWRALGFLLGLLGLVVAATFWGTSIESQIDDVVRDRREDRKVIRQLVADARAVDTSSTAGARSATAASEPAIVPPGDSAIANAPEHSDDDRGQAESPEPSDPTGKPAGQTPGEEPPPAPSSSSSTSTEPPAPEPTRSPSLLETAGATVEETVRGAGEVVQSTTCGLTAPLLCP